MSLRDSMPRKPSKPKKSKKPKPDQPLTDARYVRLVRDVQQLATRAETEGSRAKVTNVWQLGRRITREYLSQAQGYHNTVLGTLARDTSLKLRNLQYAVAFHRAYVTCPKHALSWAHYRLLLERATPDTRERYAQAAVTKGLDVRGLRQYIALDQPNAPSAGTLPRPIDPSYLYKANVIQVIDGDTMDLRIDLGFHVDRRGRFRLASINCPQD